MLATVLFDLHAFIFSTLLDYLKHSLAASEEANERDGITPED